MDSYCLCGRFAFLKGKIKIWPAGVDVKYWKPKNNYKHEKNVLVYKKKNAFFQESLEEIAINVETILKKYGWNPLIITYGDYNHKIFRDALEKSQFAVFLCRHESQGLASLESWAMNVPTVPLNIKTQKTDDRIYNVSSSCPYLTEQTGIDWEHLEQFEQIIKNIESMLPNFTPRQWVLEHMTDEISAKILLNIVEQLQ